MTKIEYLKMLPKFTINLAGQSSLIALIEAVQLTYASMSAKQRQCCVKKIINNLVML